MEADEQDKTVGLFLMVEGKRKWNHIIVLKNADMRMNYAGRSSSMCAHLNIKEEHI